MATTNQRAKGPAPQYTPRQTASLNIAEAMVVSAGYEILDQGNGEVAENLARRAVEIVDAVVEQAALK